MYGDILLNSPSEDEPNRVENHPHKMTHTMQQFKL